MTSAAKIRAAATRILGRMDAFKAGLAAPGRTDAIGVYDVLGGPGPVWITAKAILVPHEHTLEALSYVNMREINAPDSKEKANPESGSVRVVLDDGRTRTLKIVGGRGRFSDSFEFARFLARASKFAREEAP
jgi:hypothetical protein